jgi:hypothetical protein
LFKVQGLRFSGKKRWEPKTFDALNEMVAIHARPMDVMLSGAKHLGFSGLIKPRFFGCASE